MKKRLTRIAAVALVAASLLAVTATAADATSWPPRHGGKHHAHHVVARDTQWGG